MIVAPSLSHVELWCRDNGRSRPGRGYRDAPIAVTNMDNAQRVRGLEFETDDEILVLDRFRVKKDVVFEAEALFRARRVRSRIIRGESEWGLGESEWGY